MSDPTTRPDRPWRAVPKPAAADAEAARWRALRESIAIDRVAGDMRLASFRAFLRATVSSMSALAPDVLGSVGFDVEQALGILRPVRNWLNDAHAYISPVRRPKGRRVGGGREWSIRVDLWGGEPHDLRGDGIVREGALGDFLLIGILGSSLEIHLQGTAFQLTTRAGVAHLALDRTLPDMLAASCRGRPLDDVVDHALMRGRGLVVDEVLQTDCRSVLVFACGEIGLRTPWGTDGHLPAPDPPA